MAEKLKKLRRRRREQPLSNSLRRWLALALSLTACLLGAGAAVAKPATGEVRYEEPKYLAGEILDLKDKHLLFKFKRVATRSGSTLNVQRDFTYPDGKLAARERVVYEGDRLALYQLEETQLGAAGSARIERAPDNPSKGTIHLQYTTRAGGRPKAREEALRDTPLMADMVGPFLASHWEALQRGDKVKCRYLVVPRLETVGFTFTKDSETTLQGRRVLIIRMAATSPFVSALVAPLFFKIEEAPPHRVLEYVGRTTTKSQAGGKWQDLDALTVFDWDSAP